jgi:hypothetical protein
MDTLSIISLKTNTLTGYLEILATSKFFELDTLETKYRERGGSACRDAETAVSRE